MIKLRKTITPGEAAPFWYGRAWHNLAEDHTVLYPIPLNFLIRHLREFMIFLKWPRRSRFDKMAKQTYIDEFDSFMAYKPSYYTEEHRVSFNAGFAAGELYYRRKDLLKKDKSHRYLLVIIIAVILWGLTAAVYSVF